MFSYRSGNLFRFRNIAQLSHSFPLDVVFRIYDHVLANGIEAIFGFSIALLHKNEETLLKMKFDEILGFLNMKLFDIYKVCLGVSQSRELICVKVGDAPPTYKVDEFIRDAVSLRISSFMLDNYAHEYEEMMVRTAMIPVLHGDTYAQIARNAQERAREGRAP